MKAHIITFHFVNNFGGALQAYALSHAVEDATGCETRIIDYRHWFIRFTDTVRILPITSNIKEIMTGLGTFPEIKGRLQKFRKFHKEDFNLSKRYSTMRQLKKYPKEDSKFICGSDQIWNHIVTLGVASPYYLAFVKNKADKISYAASFGVSEIPDKYHNTIAKNLQKFKAISMREEDGVQLVRSLVDKEATQVIDPTFLLTKEEWEAFAIEPEMKEPYILIYTMQNNPAVYKYGEQIKELLGIKVVAISRYGYKYDGVDEIVMNIGPREFVGLFKEAAYVCTNSFHGLAFSAILEKKFFVVPSNRFNARIDSLTKVLGLKIYKEITEEIVKNDSYDVEDLRTRIASERDKAFAFLKENLQ